MAVCGKLGAEPRWLRQEVFPWTKINNGWSVSIRLLMAMGALALLLHSWMPPGTLSTDSAGNQTRHAHAAGLCQKNPTKLRPRRLIPRCEARPTYPQ